MSIRQAYKTLDQFAMQNFDDASTPVLYVGKIDLDGDWIVSKIDTTTGVVKSYASEKNNSSYTSYDTAWAARASLTYGTWQEVF